MCLTMSAPLPFHPATVHFPISFLSLSWSLDLLHYAVTRSPTVSRWSTPLSSQQHLPTLSLVSHCLLGLGVISGFVSVVSGGAQLSKMLSNAGLYESDGKTVRPKIKIAFVHAVMNDATILAAAYSWYVRWVGGPAAGPSPANVLISALSLPLTLYSAHLGGKLVYNYGVGIHLEKRAKSN